MVKYGYTIVYVNDVAKELEFFSSVFGLKPKMVNQEVSYAELDTGSTTLSFVKHSVVEAHLTTNYVKIEPNCKPLGIELAFISDNVEEDYLKAIEHGAKVIRAPSETQWGQVISYIQTPQGVLIDICSKIEE